ncbi:ribulose-1,5-bisphosphate carboxylase/oxygenase small subunit N-methyltransferase I [Phaeodactylum tricornutum CCAP 1055/1]|jgi:histone-lysine N-methyltransferase SETD3|uniref:Ribulose-1,5-bisphosphate carboxylase/oxygenase small subunit N-methyltransferase I n=1 Tax=Phaeodactylum tricornutum (strain CCAP 1055/1) TaxID=556484 RepID=B5Y418_PHATC|nr:ribulose-1,5-bisphosphate carboxylase/oxygenase small subunit N-methyltransferase I [Phaeodactylum tricornutum CCAP 1055/1]ACI65232.1 ribulose-1,5-bisphosphate carboxylase/oxygenase small subunit N-methyltransferase I [Phaeodactylum tricornutum CCAP 1055/1]|eukprot:XP_002185762.1 ribulose-1,5-bisphosphate carboxylase/oxygenase small subunit N-methyltransferase I [Phaeodactylum tricornutum CCAP 1055/1]
MRFSSQTLLVLCVAVTCTQAFTPSQRTLRNQRLAMAVDSGDSEWSKALLENSGSQIDAFNKEMKLKGLMPEKNDANPKFTANTNLIQWLTTEGNVYLSEESSWGEAPHPLAISTETKDEITNESSGRGLLARRDINDGDELLRIPMALCMTKSAARKAVGKDVLPSEINEYLAMACHLIYERNVRGEESPWKPYLDVLPDIDEVNPTFTWPDEDLAFLNGSPVIAATKSLQMKLRREYDALLGGEDGLLAKYPDRFPAEAFNFKAWEWAFTMLFSRAIRLRSLKQGETLALVPYADLINHSPFSQAYIDARQNGDWLFKSGDEEVILYADRGYRRMEQIYISYGPKSNAELLLLYGFAVERNPFNSVDVTVSIAPRTASFVKELDDDTIPVDPLAEEKAAFLEQVGRDATVDFPCYADRYPVEMLEYLRLMQMTPEDTRGKPLAEFDYSRTISLGNEAAVLTSVITAVSRQLSNYPQSEEDDAALIKDKSLFRLLSYNQRMAVRHRRNEKRLLKRTIAALEKQLQQQGLDVEDLARAEGSTLGQVLPGDQRKYGMKQKTSLEDRLQKMGLPVDLR